MTETVMQEWIELVLLPYAISVGNMNVCLILDSFAVHLRDSVRETLSRHSIETLYIPGGLTKDLQPLNVGINAPFKHWLTNAFVETRIGVDRTASEKRHYLATCIDSSWGHITRQTVINSFNRILSFSYEDIELASELYYRIYSCIVPPENRGMGTLQR